MREIYGVRFNAQAGSLAIRLHNRSRIFAVSSNPPTLWVEGKTGYPQSEVCTKLVHLFEDGDVIPDPAPHYLGSFDYSGVVKHVFVAMLELEPDLERYREEYKKWAGGKTRPARCAEEIPLTFPAPQTSHPPHPGSCASPMSSEPEKLAAWTRALAWLRRVWLLPP